MSSAETVIWSAVAGAIALVVLLALVDAVYSRSQASVQSLIYLSACWLFFLLMSGLAEALLSQTDAPWVHTAQVLIGPLCAGLGAYGASHWLSASRRDRVTDLSFRGTTLLCLVGGPLCLLLPAGLQLAASALLTVVTLSVALWLAVRATQQGDRLAWGLAAGCLLTLPLQWGLYWLALNTTRPSLLIQAVVALLGLLSVGAIAVTLWLRNHQDLQIRHQTHSRRDPVTHLYSSTVMVQKIIRAQRRLLRTRRDGALMAVQIFDPERLLAQVGHYGLNDIYSQLARRMQRHTGVVNPAGRYYDRCFVVLIETLHSPRWIRTLGLRVASSLRKPLEVTSLNGERIKLSADIGVGMVHLSGTARDVDDLLHEVQDMAVAARAMRSRAALLDEISRQAVPVENAELGASWHAMRTARSHPARLQPARQRRTTA
ncbi:MAG: diguanylate cyclase domain-containing protein [Polaromonas sp.]|uniref:diguanylate cyclase domain-containing protein n=1 Tax=Polaromonas sp. TaxID=1869339 RepID=UPI0040359ABC